MSDPGFDRGDDGRNSKDVELVRRALACDTAAFRTIMQMHNQRLFRIARGLADDDSEAEDIVQAAYVSAFAHFAEFRGESALSTWLYRIVVNEAQGRLKKKRREAAFAKSAALANFETRQFPLNIHSDDAERMVAQRQILRLVEQAITTLPGAYRVVFIARAIEGLSSEETAELLGLRSETVRTRLYRARRLIHKKLDDQIGPVLMNAFPFEGRRCDRLGASVIDRLGLPA